MKWKLLRSSGSRTFPAAGTGWMKSMDARQTAVGPSARKSRSATGSLPKTDVKTCAKMAALRPMKPLRMPTTVPREWGKLRMQVTKTAVLNHVVELPPRHRSAHIYTKIKRIPLVQTLVWIWSLTSKCHLPNKFSRYSFCSRGISGEPKRSWDGQSISSQKSEEGTSAPNWICPGGFLGGRKLRASQETHRCILV